MTSVIERPVNAQDIVFTRESVMNSVDVNSARLEGSTVQLSLGNIMLNTNITADTKIATVSVPPISRVFTVGFSIDGNPVLCYVAPDGGVYISGLKHVDANKNIYVTFTYLSNSIA